METLFSMKLGKVDPEKQTETVSILNTERTYWLMDLLWRFMLQAIT